MKMFLSAAALAMLVTSSNVAVAQSYALEYGTGNVNSSVQVRPSPDAMFAYAQSSPSVHLGAPHIAGNAVYVEGRVVGQDPDPNIRLQLLRDPPGKTW